MPIILVLKTENKQKTKRPPTASNKTKATQGCPASCKKSALTTRSHTKFLEHGSRCDRGHRRHLNPRQSAGQSWWETFQKCCSASGPLLPVALYFQGLGPCPGAKPPQCRLTQTARPCLNANIGFVRCHQGSGGHFWDRQGSTSDKHARCVGCAANQRRRGSQCSHTASCSS